VVGAIVKPMVPAVLGEKKYHVPCRSPLDKQPWFDPVKSAVQPVQSVLLLKDWLEHTVMPPLQSSGGEEDPEGGVVPHTTWAAQPS
jgi:hypothetical protein